MRRWFIPTACLLSVALSAYPAAPPAGRQPLAAQIESQRRMLQARPSAGKFKLGDLVTLSLQDGRIQGAIHEAARDMTSASRVEIEGLGGEWQVTYIQSRGAAAPTESLRLTRYDFDEASRDRLWSTSLYLYSSGAVSMTGNIGVDARRTVSLSISNGGVRLLVRDLNVGPAAAGIAVNVNAENIEALRMQCPKEMRQYVRPMLAKFFGPKVLMVKAADAYRAFPEITADPATVHQIEQLLPQLDAPLPEQRDKASAALAELGERGVLAAMRMDRSHLTPEQGVRLSAFIAGHDGRWIADAGAARKDVGFLLECLESDDRAIRAAAKEALASATGRAVSFDIDASAEDRSHAADALWEAMPKLEPERQPRLPDALRGPVN